MATKIHHMSAFAGFNDLRTLLDIIRDAKKVEKILGDISEASAKAQEVIDPADLVPDVEYTISVVETQKRPLHDAMDTFKREKRAWATEKGQRVKELNTRLAAIEQEKRERWASVEASLTRRAADLAKKEEAVRDVMERAAAKEDQLRRSLAELDRSRNEVDVRLKKLKAAMGDD